MTNEEIRKRRIDAGLAGWMVCLDAGISRSRLCGIEKGAAKASGDELARIAASIERLGDAKERVKRFAASCGFRI